MPSSFSLAAVLKHLCVSNNHVSAQHLLSSFSTRENTRTVVETIAQALLMDEAKNNDPDEKTVMRRLKDTTKEISTELELFYFSILQRQYSDTILQFLQKIPHIAETDRDAHIQSVLNKSRAFSPVAIDFLALSHLLNRSIVVFEERNCAPPEYFCHVYEDTDTSKCIFLNKPLTLRTEKSIYKWMVPNDCFITTPPLPPPPPPPPPSEDIDVDVARVPDLLTKVLNKCSLLASSFVPLSTSADLRDQLLFKVVMECMIEFAETWRESVWDRFRLQSTEWEHAKSEVLRATKTFHKMQSIHDRLTQIPRPAFLKPSGDATADSHESVLGKRTSSASTSASDFVVLVPAREKMERNQARIEELRGQFKRMAQEVLEFVVVWRDSMQSLTMMPLMSTHASFETAETTAIVSNTSTCSSAAGLSMDELSTCSSLSFDILDDTELTLDAFIVRALFDVDADIVLSPKTFSIDFCVKQEDEVVELMEILNASFYKIRGIKATNEPCIETRQLFMQQELLFFEQYEEAREGLFCRFEKYVREIHMLKTDLERCDFQELRAKFVKASESFRANFVFPDWLIVRPNLDMARFDAAIRDFERRENVQGKWEQLRQAKASVRAMVDDIRQLVTYFDECANCLFG